MGAIPNNVVSILYALAGIYTLILVVQNRRSFFDHFISHEDVRLVWMIAFFVLTPLGVLVHEAGHYLAAQHFGAIDIELQHRGYWGFVRYRAVDIHGFERLIIASAGPIVGVGFGYLCLAGAVVLRTRRIFRHILAFFAVVQVFHHLVGYPLVDLLSQRTGDFHTIYSLLPTPQIALAVMIHGVLLALLVVAWRYPPTRELVNP